MGEGWPISYSGARYYDGEREEDSRDDGREVAHGQVLDATRLGDQHHQQSPEGQAHQLRSAGPDAPCGAVGASEEAGLHHQLRYCLRPSRLHPGPYSSKNN